MDYVIDIETVPLPYDKRKFAEPTADSVKYGNTKNPKKREEKYLEAVANWTEKCALTAHTGRIALICIAPGDGDIISVYNDDESDLLSEALHGVLRKFNHLSDRLIGHNLMGFDVPFIMRRAMINAVEPGQWMRDGVKPYSCKYMIDTQKEWAAGDKGTHIKLIYLCGAFGIPVKDGPISGADFYKHWYGLDGVKENRPDCIKYCVQDVEATRDVALLMGV